MLFKLIYRLDSKAGSWRYDGGQNTASDMNYHCRIDNDIEVAMLKNEQWQWVDLEESAPTKLSEIIVPLIEKHSGYLRF